MNASPSIIVLDASLPGESAGPRADAILSGAPRALAANQYAEPRGEFYCGSWSASPGRWRVSYTEHEFCVILAGRVRIESRDGARLEFGSGDAFVVPAGFEGTWEVLEPCRKWYAVYEPKV